jgi:hypothetical protein
VQSMQNQERSDWPNTYLELVAIKQQTAEATVGAVDAEPEAQRLVKHLPSAGSNQTTNCSGYRRFSRFAPVLHRPCSVALAWSNSKR